MSPPQGRGAARPYAAAGLSLLALLVAAPRAVALGPILETIGPGGLTAELRDFVQIPDSPTTGRPARINLLGHAGDGRLFVNDMEGIIYVIENGTPTPFLDVGAATGTLVTTGLQRGVSTFAFHPNYAIAGQPGFGKFYTASSHTSIPNAADFAHPAGGIEHQSVLYEWSVDPTDANRILPGSAREILRVGQTSGDHLMGQIAFNPNAVDGDADFGKLYIALGDGGGYVANRGDEINPFRTAQDTSNPFGSILRIDPLGGSTAEHVTNGNYGIPEDNPFANSTDGSLGESWAYGFRNPHRFSWDEGGTGAMIISDIGQANIEEIDLGVAGGNYGWSDREGTFVVDHDDQSIFLPLPPGDDALGFIYPVAQYDHDDGFAIVGGFVYRGTLVPQLVGQYVFGDNNGRIFYLDIEELMDGSQAAIHELTLFYEGEQQTLLEILNSPRRADLRFGVGADHELYVLTKRDGMIRQLVPEPSPAGLLAAALAAMTATRRRRRRGR